MRSYFLIVSQISYFYIRCLIITIIWVARIILNNSVIYESHCFLIIYIYILYSNHATCLYYLIDSVISEWQSIILQFCTIGKLRNCTVAVRMITKTGQYNVIQWAVKCYNSEIYSSTNSKIFMIINYNYLQFDICNLTSVLREIQKYCEIYANPAISPANVHRVLFVCKTYRWMWQIAYHRHCCSVYLV